MLLLLIIQLLGRVGADENDPSGIIFQFNERGIREICKFMLQLLNQDLQNFEVDSKISSNLMTLRNTTVTVNPLSVDQLSLHDGTEQGTLLMRISDIVQKGKTISIMTMSGESAQQLSFFFILTFVDFQVQVVELPASRTKSLAVSLSNFVMDSASFTLTTDSPSNNPFMLGYFKNFVKDTLTERVLKTFLQEAAGRMTEGVQAMIQSNFKIDYELGNSGVFLSTKILQIPQLNEKCIELELDGVFYSQQKNYFKNIAQPLLRADPSANMAMGVISGSTLTYALRAFDNTQYPLEYLGYKFMVTLKSENAFASIVQSELILRDVKLEGATTFLFSDLLIRGRVVICVKVEGYNLEREKLALSMRNFLLEDFEIVSRVPLLGTFSFLAEMIIETMVRRLKTFEVSAPRFLSEMLIRSLDVSLVSSQLMILADFSF